MKRVYKSKENRKLKPGENHNFFVLKFVLLPDGKEYFVLRDTFGDKHLLPAIYYKDYPISINSHWICHVDKINCQGRIFLEPEHPYYKTGNIYPFIFGKIVALKSKKGGEKLYYQMLGDHDVNSYLPVHSSVNLEMNGFIQCRIVKIKKGRIFVEPADLI